MPVGHDVDTRDPFDLSNLLNDFKQVSFSLSSLIVLRNPSQSLVIGPGMILQERVTQETWRL